jgi:hypothetical protein
MHYITIDPNIQRFEPTTMHYTTIDWPPPKSQFEPTSKHSPPLTPKSQRFKPKAMHYTTLTQKKSEIRPQDHALHHH